MPASKTVKPQSAARSAIDRSPSTLHSIAHSHGPSTTSSAAAPAVDSTGTASGAADARHDLVPAARRARRRSAEQLGDLDAAGRRPGGSACSCGTSCSATSSAAGRRACRRPARRRTPRRRRGRRSPGRPAARPGASPAARCAGSPAPRRGPRGRARRTTSAGRRAAGAGRGRRRSRPSRHGARPCASSPSGSVSVEAPGRPLEARSSRTCPRGTGKSPSGTPDLLHRVRPRPHRALYSPIGRNEAVGLSPAEPTVSRDDVTPWAPWHPRP